MLRYAITDRMRAASPEPDRMAGVVAQARRLAADGVDFLQLREKDLDAKELIGLTRRIITAVHEASGTRGPLLRVLVNGRPDVALAAGADGVHLPSGPEQLTVAQVRGVFGARAAIISIACHTLREVESASDNGADLILFSPVYGKLIGEGKEMEATGLARLDEACRAAGETPVLALGGVTAANARSCVDVGAKGIAGIRLFLERTAGV